MSSVVRDRKAAEAAFWRAHAARLDADLTVIPSGSRTGAYLSEADRARALAQAIERELEEEEPQTVNGLPMVMRLPINGAPGHPAPLLSVSVAPLHCKQALVCTFPNCNCPRKMVAAG